MIKELSSLEGAEALIKELHNYWHERGYVFQAHAVHVQGLRTDDAHSGQRHVYMVRSRTLNGYPMERYSHENAQAQEVESGEGQGPDPGCQGQEEKQ